MNLPTMPQAFETSNRVEAGAEEGVAIVIPTFNHARYLGEAIESCRAQTLPPREIIVVDDGSSDDPAAVVAGYPGVKLIRQENRGLAGARNTGLRAASAPFIAFLDADDRLLPEALAVGAAALAAHPDWAFVYGAHRRIDGAGHPTSPSRVTPPHGGDLYRSLLSHGNIIEMHASALFRREALATAGGYDEAFRSCEDYDLHLRIARQHPGGWHDRLVAEYRWHGENMSNNSPRMLAFAERALDKQESADSDAASRGAIAEGRRFWRSYYGVGLAKSGLRAIRAAPGSRAGWRDTARAIRMAPRATLGFMASQAARRFFKRIMPGVLGRLLRGDRWLPRTGGVAFGDFGRTAPIDAGFGYGRGQPIDRYYIEAFLARNAADIRGRVLEIGDNAYTIRFGGARVTQSDVLHIDDPAATFRGDISDPSVLPGDAFDCIVFTQTLHLIFDMPAAVRGIRRALKPGGAALITVPGITPVDRGDWGGTWFWSLTEAALGRLLAAEFGEVDVATETHGNVLAAVSFLEGLASSEVPAVKLDIRDKAYPVTVAARVTKGAA